jgi:CRP-like cAMP-binding protein
MVDPSGKFNIPAWLEAAGVGRTLIDYGPGDAIFTQGDPCEHVWYIDAGDVHGQCTGSP